MPPSARPPLAWAFGASMPRDVPARCSGAAVSLRRGVRRRPPSSSLHVIRRSISSSASGPDTALDPETEKDVLERIGAFLDNGRVEAALELALQSSENDRSDADRGASPSTAVAALKLFTRRRLVAASERLYRHIGDTGDIAGYGAAGNVIVRLYYSVGRISDACRLLERQRLRGVKTDVYGYNALLERCVWRAPEPSGEAHASSGARARKTSPAPRACDGAAEVLSSMLVAGVRPNAGTYTALLRAHERHRQQHRLPPLWQLLLRSGVWPPEAATTMLIESLVKARRGEIIAQLLDDLASMLRSATTPKAPTDQRELRQHQRTLYDTLLRTYSSLGAFAEVDAVFRRLQGDGVRPIDARWVSALMKALGKLGRLPRIWEVYDSLVEGATDADDGGEGTLERSGGDGKEDAGAGAVGGRGCVNVVVYTSMIQALTEHGELDGALKVFAEMKRRRVRPNEITYNTLISGFGSAPAASTVADTSSAELLFDEMRNEAPRWGVEPSVVSYTALLKVYARVGRVDAIQRVMRWMRDANVRPNVYTYNVLMDALGHVSLDSAESVFREMISAGVPPNTISYNVRMKVSVRQGNYAHVERVFAQLQQRSLRPDRVSFNTLIDARARAGDLEAAERAMAEMMEAGLKPDCITFNSIIHGFIRLDRPDDALQRLEAMKARKLEPDHVTYASLVAYMVEKRRFKDARSLKTEGNRRGLNVRVRIPDLQAN